MNERVDKISHYYRYNTCMRVPILGVELEVCQLTTFENIKVMLLYSVNIYFIRNIGSQIHIDVNDNAMQWVIILSIRNMM